jgi:hypothetical protein
MTNEEELRNSLQTMIRRGLDVDICLVLKELLERGELNSRMGTEGGRKSCVWTSRFSDRSLDRIATIENDLHRNLLELFVEGHLEFTTYRFGKGPEIYWRPLDSNEKSLM